jgi:hypothetical protein
LPRRCDQQARCPSTKLRQDPAWHERVKKQRGVDGDVRFISVTRGLDGATLYGVLSRGLLSDSKPTDVGDMRAHLPRFAADHRDRNGAVIEAVRKFAADRGQTAAQLCIAWALAKKPGFVPTIGARTPEQINGVLGALDKPLSASEVTELEKLVPRDAIAGTRYPTPMMAHLDSEH